MTDTIELVEFVLCVTCDLKDLGIDISREPDDDSKIAKTLIELFEKDQTNVDLAVHTLLKMIGGR